MNPRRGGIRTVTRAAQQEKYFSQEKPWKAKTSFVKWCKYERVRLTGVADDAISANLLESAIGSSLSLSQIKNKVLAINPSSGDELTSRIEVTYKLAKKSFFIAQSYGALIRYRIYASLVEELLSLFSWLMGGGASAQPLLFFTCASNYSVW